MVLEEEEEGAGQEAGQLLHGGQEPLHLHLPAEQQPLALHRRSSRRCMPSQPSRMARAAAVPALPGDPALHAVLVEAVAAAAQTVVVVYRRAALPRPLPLRRPAGSFRI